METEPDIKEVKRWLVRKLTGEITAPEEERLRRWMERDPGNKELVERILSRPFLTRAILDRHKAAQRTSWQALRHKIGYSRRLRPRLLVRRWVAVAAGVAALLVGGAAYYYYMNYSEPLVKAGVSQAVVYVSERENPLPFLSFSDIRQEEASEQPRAEKVVLSPNLHTTVVVPAGAEYRLMLADSTKVWLNAGTSLCIPTDFSPVNRTLNLSGEAYLEVHKDSVHPFVVQTARADVHVLGTKLNIEAYEDEAETCITLAEGKVEIFTGRETVELPVGHAATINSDHQVRIIPADVYERTAWHQGRIVFNERPLESIMRRLGRWYGVETSFSSDDVRNLCFTFDVDRHDLFNHLARQIEKVGELNVRITRKKQVLISEKHEQ